MTQLFFRVGARRFEAGEIVYHVGVEAFARVDGISSGSVELIRDNGAAYFAAPALCIQGVAEVKAFYDDLRAIDVGLARWLIKAWRDGATLDECRDRLRRAMSLRETK